MITSMRGKSGEVLRRGSQDPCSVVSHPTERGFLVRETAALWECGRRRMWWVESVGGGASDMWWGIELNEWMDKWVRA